MAKTTLSRKKADQTEEFEEVEESTLEDELTPLADNSAAVPLFAMSDGRSRRSIAVLKLYKLEGTHFAYKGTISLNSTKDTIGQQFGDGSYTIEACNNKHKVLDTLENIYISLSGPVSPRQLELSPTNHSASKEELDRIERLATASSTARDKMSSEFTTLVTNVTSAAASREREFMAGVQKNQSEFMTGMLALLETSHKQSMAMLITGHSQVMQQLAAVSASKPDDKNKGTEMVEVLLKGLTLGRELAEGDDEDEESDFWEDILQGGFQLLSGVKKTQALGSGEPESKETPKPKKSLSVGQRKALAEAIQLRRIVRSSGLSPAEAIARLQGGAPVSQPEESEPGDADDEDTEDEDESEAESDSFESAESA
jgi:hypothetical protein